MAIFRVDRTLSSPSVMSVILLLALGLLALPVYRFRPWEADLSGRVLEFGRTRRLTLSLAVALFVLVRLPVVPELLGPVVTLLVLPLRAAPQVLFGAKVFYADLLGETAGQAVFRAGRLYVEFLWLYTVGRLVPRELTLVLSRDTGIYPKSTYGSNPYSGYAESERVGFDVGSVDGVSIGNASRAYPEETVTGADVINDEVGGVSVLVVEDQREGGVKLFVREVDGEPVRFSLSDGRLVDEAGNEWSFDGEAREGPHAGAELDRLNSHGIFWFAWSEFHPETVETPSE